MPSENKPGPYSEFHRATFTSFSSIALDSHPLVAFSPCRSEWPPRCRTPTILNPHACLLVSFPPIRCPPPFTSPSTHTLPPSPDIPQRKRGFWCYLTLWERFRVNSFYTQTAAWRRCVRLGGANKGKRRGGMELCYANRESSDGRRK